jgi:hypothetical protein
VATVYLAEVGFRSPGVRLVAPVRTAVEGRTLTLRDLVATADGTELTYDVFGLKGEEGFSPRQDVVAIRSGEVERVLERGAFSFRAEPRFSAGPSSLVRTVRSTSTIPHEAGRVEITIAIETVGEFRVAPELRPFGPETEALRTDVDTSVTHEGITVSVRGVGTAREETAIEIEVAVPDDECCVGIGGLNGSRLGPTAISLRDDGGRMYMERWREPVGYDHETLAIFQPIHPDARHLVLAVPYVIVEEPLKTDAVPLPVTTPVDVSLGRYPIRILGTSIHASAKERAVEDRAPRLGVDLDLGGWHGDRRVVLPGRPIVDGVDHGVSYGPRWLDARRPEPVDLLYLSGGRALEARSLAFTRPTIQVRGPWRIGFSVAPRSS